MVYHKNKLIYILMMMWKIFGISKVWVMLWIHKNVQLCATTRLIASCDWWMYDGGSCGNTLPPLTTRHVASVTWRVVAQNCTFFVSLTLLQKFTWQHKNELTKKLYIYIYMNYVMHKKIQQRKIFIYDTYFFNKY